MKETLYCTCGYPIGAEKAKGGYDFKDLYINCKIVRCPSCMFIIIRENLMELGELHLDQNEEGID